MINIHILKELHKLVVENNVSNDALKLSDGSYLSAAADWLEWEVRGVAGSSSGSGAEVKRVAGVETLLLALKPHTNYTVQALAYTAAGDGVPAPPIHCTTQQDGMLYNYSCIIKCNVTVLRCTDLNNRNHT